MLSGKDDSPLQLGERAITTDRKDPKAVARNLAASAKVNKGGRLAKEGKVEEAIALFKQAQKLDPDIDLDPSTKEVRDKDPKAVARSLAATFQRDKHQLRLNLD